jgi:hypothetical protein
MPKQLARSPLQVIRRFARPSPQLAFNQRLHALVRLIRRFWGVGFFSVRLVRRLRQRWLLGGVRIRRCSWMGKRRFERFGCAATRVVDHDAAPGRWAVWGERRRSSGAWFGRHNFQPRPLPIYKDGTPCRGRRDVQNCSVRKECRYLGGHSENQFKGTVDGSVRAINFPGG